MKKRLAFLLAGITALTTGTLALAILSNHKNRSFIYNQADVESPYVLTLNNANAPAGLAADSASLALNNAVVNATVKTTKNNDVALQIIGGYQNASGFVTLANHGQINNFKDSENGIINDINAIKVTFSSGSVKLRTSPIGALSDGGVNLTPAVALTNGVKYELPIKAKYFQLEAGDAATSITSIEIGYTCASAIDMKISLFNGTFTGKSGQFNYTLTMNNGVATWQQQKDGVALINGTASLDNTGLHLVFPVDEQNVTLNYAPSGDGYKLTYLSKSGATKDQIANPDFYRVYEVEDFESYSERGNGYDQQHTVFETSGARSQYYAEYNPGGDKVSTPIGGSGWNRMGGDYDYVQYSSSQGKNGSKTLAFKGNTNKMRYLQMKGLYGTNNALGRGTKMSFWVKSFSNSTLSTVSSTATSFKLMAYYRTDLSPSTVNNDNYRKAVEFSLPANSDWKEFTLDIDSTKNVYIFGLYSATSTKAYIALDDIRIYTESPYTMYHPVTGVSLNTPDVDMYVGHTYSLKHTIAPSNATTPGVTWESSNPDVATVTNGVVEAVAKGNATITVRTNEGNFTATCDVSVVDQPELFLSGTFVGEVETALGKYPVLIASGSQGYMDCAFNGRVAGVKNYTYNSSTHEFSFDAIDTITLSNNARIYAGHISGVIEDGTFKNVAVTNVTANGTPLPINNSGSINFVKQTAWFNDCDGNDAALQDVFARRVKDGSWAIDTETADRITSSTTRVDGTGALQLLGNSSKEVSLTLRQEIPSEEREAYNNISFWVHNSSDKDLSIVTYVYKATNYGSYEAKSTITVKPNTWQYLTCGFTGTLYNFQMYVKNAAPTALVFDNICLYNYTAS